MSEVWAKVQKSREVPGAQEEMSLTKALSRILPIGDDTTLHIANTVVVPASSVVRITFTFSREYYHFIKKLYIDAGPGCSYAWIIDNYYRFGGNEHKLSLPIILQRTLTIVVIITNDSTEDQSLDYVIDGWSRFKR